MNKKPFTLFVDLDYVTVKCPCGASVIGEGEKITLFYEKHREHTNGKVKERITDNGMRVFTADTPRFREYDI
ncbi:MAG: hypothetical protein RBT05_06940 [Bacteroidales bacterium]|nr:hypothetical protein [Bacteroidales bacterium]